MKITKNNIEDLRYTLQAMMDAVEGLGDALDIFEEAETDDERAVAQETANTYMADLAAPLADLGSN